MQETGKNIWPYTWIVSLFLVFTPGLHADDWPQWRGPDRDSVWHETNVLGVFPRNGLKVRWRSPLASGFSSPVIADGRVFVTDTLIEGTNAWERVHGFDASTGRLIWVNKTEGHYPDWATKPGQEHGPIATPIARGGRLYVLGSFGRLTCFEATSGNVVWKKDLMTEYDFPEMGTTDVSPLIDGQCLVNVIGAKPGAAVVALDKDTGKELWRALDDSQGYSAPIIINAGGTRQLVVWTREAVTSLSPDTGQTLWREVVSTPGDSVIATPVFDGNRLLISGLMLRLSEGKPGAEILWPEVRAHPRRVFSNTSTPVLKGDYVFAAKTSGELVCLRADSSKEIWRTDAVTDGRSGNSIQITPNGDSFVLFNNRGELIRARLDAQGYHEVGRVQLIEPTTMFGGRKVAWSPPAFANRHVYVRSDRELICASLAAD